MTNEPKLTKREQEIDDIDRQLFALESCALRIGNKKLSEAIKAARFESYLLLPAWRKEELR